MGVHVNFRLLGRLPPESSSAHLMPTLPLLPFTVPERDSVVSQDPQEEVITPPSHFTDEGTEAQGGEKSLP